LDIDAAAAARGSSPKGNTCTTDITEENSRVFSTKLVERWNLICAYRIIKDKI
jgi:hypothetical protein